MNRCIPIVIIGLAMLCFLPACAGPGEPAPPTFVAASATPMVTDPPAIAPSATLIESSEPQPAFSPATLTPIAIELPTETLHTSESAAPPVYSANEEAGEMLSSPQPALSVPPTDTPVPNSVTAETSQRNLTGVNWQWLSLTGPDGTLNVINPELYTVIFHPDETSLIHAACVMVLATYKAEAGNLAINLGMSNMPPCPFDVQEQLFLDALGTAASYYFVGSDLYIELGDGGGIMHLAPG